MLDAGAAGVPSLAKGALVLKIERGDAVAQVRIAHAEDFNPHGGLILWLAFGLELPLALARVHDLGVIVDAGGGRGGDASPGSERGS